MNEPAIIAQSERSPLHDRLIPVRLHLHNALRVELSSGSSLPIKARKARALLTLLALSETQTISRQNAAATLWSSVERPVGLARLRDMLHNLRKGLRDAGADIIGLRDDTILLVPGTVTIDVPTAVSHAVDEFDRASEFMIDLDGLDPSFDRWLAHTRAEARRGKFAPRPNAVAKDLLDDDSTSPAAIGVTARPSVAVIEIDVIATQSEVRSAHALADEIGIALARLRWFTTITRGSLGQRLVVGSEDLSKIADYALVGTLQAENRYFRLVLKLVDLHDSIGIAWTSSFEESQAFGIEVHESIANAVAARLDTELLLIEIKRARSSPSPDSAYDLVLRALPGIHRLERAAFLASGHLLEQAVAADKESAFAHGWLAYWHIFLVGQGWATNPSQAMRHAEKIADRAMMLDPKDARATAIGGHVKAFLNRRLEDAMILHEMALQLNPALGLAWHLAGMTHAYAGRLDEALRCISHSRVLAPTDPLGFFVEGALSIVHLLRHEHQQAADLGRRVTERHPNFTSAFKSYLAALGHLGRRAEARDVYKRLLLLEPRFTLQRFHATAPYQRSADLEHYTNGLRLAGVA